MQPFCNPLISANDKAAKRLSTSGRLLERAESAEGAAHGPPFSSSNRTGRSRILRSRWSRFWHSASSRIASSRVKAAHCRRTIANDRRRSSISCGGPRHEHTFDLPETQEPWGRPRGGGVSPRTRSRQIAFLGWTSFIPRARQRSSGQTGSPMALPAMSLALTMQTSSGEKSVSHLSQCQSPSGSKPAAIKSARNRARRPGACRRASPTLTRSLPDPLAMRGCYRCRPRRGLVNSVLIIR